MLTCPDQYLDLTYMEKRIPVFSPANIVQIFNKDILIKTPRCKEKNKTSGLNMEEQIKAEKVVLPSGNKCLFRENRSDMMFQQHKNESF